MDLVGKASNQPVVNLFGGRVRDEVEYYYLARSTPEQMAADAAAGYERGFRTFYLKASANDPADDIERVERSTGRSALVPASGSTPTRPGRRPPRSGSSRTWRGSV